MRWRVLKVGKSMDYASAYEPLKEIADIVTVEATREAVLEKIGDCDACMAALTVRMDREILDRAKRLRVIATPATGTDHIDLAAAEEKGVTIISLKHDTEFLSNVTATAELAWALMLATIRYVPYMFGQSKAGHWRGGGRYKGHQISGMTLGILGYGRLGRIVGQYGKAFRMRVLACDIRSVTPDDGVTMVDLDTLLRESDVLTIHIHVQGNEGLIGKSAFAKTKRGAYLVNTSRGAIIDEGAFLEALESGKLAGAGVDVIQGEWDADLARHPLIQYACTHDNLVITPHVGGVTYESQEMTLKHTVMKLRRFLESLGG